MARPWPGGEKRIGGRASHHEACEAIGSFLLPCMVTGVSLLAVWCLSGATPRGQPWTTAVTLPHGHNGLSARRMAVVWTFREPSRCRPVHREFMRSALRDVPPRVPATACHQRHDVERYRRSTGRPSMTESARGNSHATPAALSIRGGYRQGGGPRIGASFAL